MRLRIAAHRSQTLLHRSNRIRSVRTESCCCDDWGAMPHEIASAITESEAMKIRQTDPSSPEAVTILEQSWRFLDAMFPPDQRFRLDMDSLRASNITFFMATEGGMATGCAAFAQQGDDWGELKSMFVASAARGSGAAKGLLDAVELCAREKGCTTLRLESGTGLDVAHRFYEREGFHTIGPFGAYPDVPSSVFMEKNLAPDSGDGDATSR